MITNTFKNALASNTLSTESIEFDLTPTVLKQYSSKNPSSLLSLSNYLQFEDSSLFYHEKYPQSNQKKTNKQQKVIKKSRLFIQDYSHIEKSNLKQSFCHQNQDSQSMLLLDSGIRQNTNQMQESSKLLDSKQLLTQAISLANQDQNETKQSLFSRIQQKQPSKDKNYCTDSIELMNLLSIPNDSEISKLRQSIRQITKNDNQLQNLKKIMEFFSQNICMQDKLTFSCTKCKDFEKRIKILEQYIDLKEKQISKYESLIDQLNSKVFDLKIQNKRLSFQNQKYLHQVEELFSERTNLKSKQRLNTMSHESIEDCSFFDDENFGVINSAVVSRALSRKNTTKEVRNQNAHHTKNLEQDSYLSPSKAYPQTPMPTMTYIKPKKQRKPSNFSGHSLQVSISKVKQPSLYRIAQMKIDKILKQNDIKSKEIKTQNNLQRQNSTKRFSNLLNRGKINNLDENKERISLTQKQDDNRKSNRSPLKKHDFYKVKTKQFPSSKNLKNHPLNKISQQQDNISQSSQTKTQKFQYGIKKLQSQTLLEQNDYNVLNRKNSIKGLQNNKIKANKKLNTILSQKNEVVYKSFKEIGTLNNQNLELKQITCEKNKTKNQSPLKFQNQYGIHSYIKNTENKNFMNDKNERKCFSPIPNSLSSRKQNTQRSNTGNSPFSKQFLRQTQIKSFLR